MPKILTDERERKICLSISLDAQTIARFDENIERLKNDFKSLGMDEKDIKRTICRSGLIGEFVQLLATPNGYGMMRNTISLALGLDFKQGELFDE